MENDSQMSLDFGEQAPHDQEVEFLLLSLQREYYELIRNGSKRYEYRRVFKRHATNAFIYITSPDKVVPGYVEFGKPIMGTPEEISKLAEAQRKGHGQAVYDYLKGMKKCYAVPIKRLHELRQELSLETIKQAVPEMLAPQSYISLSVRPRLLKFLKDHEFVTVVDHEGTHP